MKQFIFVLFLIISNLSFAQSKCSKAEVDTQYMPKNNDQGNLRWCFAYSAADILSYFEKIPLSSYSIATNHHSFNQYDKPITEIGSVTGEAIVRATYSKGLCLENETDFTGGDWGKLSEFIAKIESGNIIELGFTCLKKDKETTIDLIENVQKILEAIPPNQRIAAIFEMTCKNPYQLKNKYNVKMSHRLYVGQEKVMEDLDKALDSNEPVSIGYDIDLVLKKDEDEHRPYLHASTIIGRRWNEATSKCEYLIKNSWGNECPKKIKIDCTNGNFWASREKLQSSIDLIYTVEIKK